LAGSIARLASLDYSLIVHTERGGHDVSESDEERDQHRRYGKELNNLTWRLLQKPDRSLEEDETMIHAAHASSYHWSIVGTPVNFARGEWLISHAHAVLQRPEGAIHYAKRCLQICRDNEIADFDIAYAHEGMARAHAAAGQKIEAEKHLRLAKEAGSRIADEEDRDLFFQDLKTEPWFGLS
jgi:tetratricopeptide (TPR) repeat protein